MKTTGTSKIFVDKTEQQENVKNCRKTLGVLQQVSADKENIIGRPMKPGKIGDSETVEKKKRTIHRGIQTENEKISVEDLTTADVPSDAYWKVLAEKRGEALTQTLKENEELHEKMSILVEENKTYKEMLTESKNLVAILTEMLEESEHNTTETGLEATEIL